MVTSDHTGWWGEGERQPGRAREGVTAGTQTPWGTLHPPQGQPMAMPSAASECQDTQGFLPNCTHRNSDGNAASYFYVTDVGYTYLQAMSYSHM